MPTIPQVLFNAGFRESDLSDPNSKIEHRAHAEVTDWDLSTVFLFGLDATTVTPAKARAALKEGRLELYPESKVQHELKTMCTYLVNHQNQTPVWKAKVMGLRTPRSAHVPRGIESPTARLTRSSSYTGSQWN